MTGRNMKLTIESMTYGADGLAHADNGKAVFVQGAVAGDTVEAEVVQDGKSFMRARTTEIPVSYTHLTLPTILRV